MVTVLIIHMAVSNFRICYIKFYGIKVCQNVRWERDVTICCFVVWTGHGPKLFNWRTAEGHTCMSHCKNNIHYAFVVQASRNSDSYSCYKSKSEAGKKHKSNRLHAISLTHKSRYKMLFWRFQWTRTRRLLGRSDNNFHSLSNEVRHLLRRR